MKQPFGAKSARSCLRLMIAANHKTEGAVSASAVGKACRPMSPRNVSFQACRSRHCSTRLAFDRE
jgi:hypothetical protein